MAQPQAAIRRKLLRASRLAKPARARNGRTLPRAFFLTDPDRTKNLARVRRAVREALAGIDRINSDYAVHARRAREIAAEHFAADRVLTRLLDLCGR